jgi:glycosyltransferase involved in cell wall biosynthesis
MLGGKLAPLLRGAALCLCGNRYLQDYAARYCANTMIMPTVVDTGIYRPAESRGNRPVTIGWIGSPTTWPYVQAVLPVLERVAERHGARIRIVGAGAVATSESALVDFVEWDEAAEVSEVQAMDIGVMPLPDEDWARGKCGYKLIQYMACGLPVVASPVGVNSEIVTEGVNGLLARTDAEWESALTALIADPARAKAMGEAGRSRVVVDYSLATHGPRFAAAIKSVAR